MSLSSWIYPVCWWHAVSGTNILPDCMIPLLLSYILIWKWCKTIAKIGNENSVMKLVQWNLLATLTPCLGSVVCWMLIFPVSLSPLLLNIQLDAKLKCNPCYFCLVKQRDWAVVGSLCWQCCFCCINWWLFWVLERPGLLRLSLANSTLFAGV